MTETRSTRFVLFPMKIRKQWVTCTGLGYSSMYVTCLPKNHPWPKKNAPFLCPVCVVWFHWNTQDTSLQKTLLRVTYLRSYVQQRLFNDILFNFFLCLLYIFWKLFIWYHAYLKVYHGSAKNELKYTNITIYACIWMVVYNQHMQQFSS